MKTIYRAIVLILERLGRDTVSSWQSYRRTWAETREHINREWMKRSLETRLRDPDKHTVVFDNEQTVTLGEWPPADLRSHLIKLGEDGDIKWNVFVLIDYDEGAISYEVLQETGTNQVVWVNEESRVVPSHAVTKLSTYKLLAWDERSGAGS